MKKNDSLFDGPFLERFSSKRILLPLGAVFTAGVLIGSAAASWLELFYVYSAFPLQVSGIPSPGAGFASCFSTFLLNALISLIVLFLMGVTAFGAIGVPLCLLLKGAAVGVGALSFLAEGNAIGLARSALAYLPASAALALLLLLFATRALSFSRSLAKAGFSASTESLNFRFYLKDFLVFLCFSVVVSLAGGWLAVLSGVLL